MIITREQERDPEFIHDKIAELERKYTYVHFNPETNEQEERRGAMAYKDYVAYHYLFYCWWKYQYLEVMDEIKELKEMIANDYNRSEFVEDMIWFREGNAKSLKEGMERARIEHALLFI